MVCGEIKLNFNFNFDFDALNIEILEDINDAMNDNNEQLIRTTRNIRYIDRQSNTCGNISLLFFSFLN